MHISTFRLVCLGALTALTLTFGCGPTRSNAPAVRTGGTASFQADGGLPVKPSTRQGVVTPGDTGMNANPSGSASSTGTAAGSMGNSLGNQPAGGN